MKVTVVVNQDEAIRAGRNEWGEIEMELDVSVLSEEEREVLAECASSDNRKIIGSVRTGERIAAATPENARTVLRFIAERKKAEAEKKRIEHEKYESAKARTRSDLESIYQSGGISAIVDTRMSNDVLPGLPDLNMYRMDYLLDIVGLSSMRAEYDAETERRKKEYEVARESARKYKEAREAEEKAAFCAEKRRWIEAHGSERLRKSEAGGYSNTVPYMNERLKKDVGDGWEIDVNRAMGWNTKRYPSERALDLEVSLKKQGYDSEIGLLTDNGDDKCEFEFECCEVVVIKNYLGKYDVVYKMPSA